MKSNNSVKSFIFFSRTGCLLPLFMVLNLLFGWTFLAPLHWLLVEALLVLLFILNVFIITRKILSPISRSKEDDVVDVEGEVVEK